MESCALLARWLPQQTSGSDLSYLSDFKLESTDVRSNKPEGIGGREACDAFLISKDMKGQNRVMCRVRPLNEKELSRGEPRTVTVVDDMTVEVTSSI